MYMNLHLLYKSNYNIYVYKHPSEAFRGGLPSASYFVIKIIYIFIYGKMVINRERGKGIEGACTLCRKREVGLRFNSI